MTTTTSTRWARLERLAARQHGVVLAWQVLSLGIDYEVFRSFAKRHGWTTLGRGVYASPHSVPSFARRCAIEVNRGPRARLLTGEAQLALLGARRVGPWAIDVWVRPGLSLARRPGVHYHRAPWTAGDRVHRVQGIPCTPVLRAVRDVAKRSSVDRLERDFRALDRRRLTTPEAAAADLDRRGRFVGRHKVVEALTRLGVELSHSAEEARARRLVRDAGMTPHPRPLLISCGARRLGEIDIPFCDVRFGLEVDGPPHLEDGEAERDAARDRLLHDRAGWLIERVTDVDLQQRPGEVLARVRAGIERAGARDLSPWPCGRCVA
jgi:hypothetical protein